MRPPSKAVLDLAKIAAAVNDPQGPVPRLLRYHDAHPITFMMVLMKGFKELEDKWAKASSDTSDDDRSTFGLDWLEWDAEVLHGQIIELYGALNISEHNWQKIQAIRTLMTTVGFWSEWEIFEKVIHSLNNNVPRFDIAQPCSVAQLMAGVDIANSMRDETFSDEIQRYVAACAIEEGVTYLPPPLDFAQDVLSDPMYRCKDCGRIDVDDLDDDRCDFCCGRFSDGRLFNWKANPALPASAGTNIVRYKLREPAPVQYRFEQLKLKNPGRLDLSDESVEDVQASKLMVAWDYMKMRQTQLNRQLKELEAWVVS
jgi:hypothetical protein